MKRFRVHLAVNELADSLVFYSQPFGVAGSTRCRLLRLMWARRQPDSPGFAVAISAPR